jgi:hypothetical protein
MAKDIEHGSACSAPVSRGQIDGTGGISREPAICIDKRISQVGRREQFAGIAVFGKEIQIALAMLRLDGSIVPTED